jgi:hypothetical protein
MGPSFIPSHTRAHKGEGEGEFNLFSTPINTWCET